MFQNSLLRKFCLSYLGIGISLYVFLFAYWGVGADIFNMVNVITLLAYGFLILLSCNKPDEYYSNSHLCLTVFIYSVIFVLLFWQVSDYYAGNTFLFSEVDARKYERYSMVMKDMNFNDALTYISHIWKYEDWGAPMSMAVIFKIVPSKVFLNFCYVLMNTISAYFLFDIAKRLMMVQYAYIATLVYAISSYSIFFQGCFLKEEIMMFWVILSFFSFYRYWYSRNVVWLLAASITALLLLFFRPAVMLLLFGSYATLLLYGEKQNTQRFFFLIILLAGVLVISTLVQSVADRYVAGGDIRETHIFKTTSTFQKIGVAVGALIGPFPQLFAFAGNVNKVPFHSTGILFKFLLYAPFWIGMIHSVRSRAFEVFPIFAFSVLETFALITVFELEIRKFIPHVPFFIMGAFWYMSQFDEDADDEIQRTPYYIWVNRVMNIGLLIVFVVSMLWNVLRSGHGSATL